MKHKIVVMGAGLVGKAIAIDLARRHFVVAVDINRDLLADLENVEGISAVARDMSLPGAITEVVADADLVVGALPGFMGYSSVEQVIAAGKNIVDISFFPEDPFPLDEPAKKQGVTAVVDCGVAPGMSNIILGYHNQQMQVENYRCLVGGLPVRRQWPWEYQAVFSPIDVIEEYVRPARYVEQGQLVVREALSDAELVEFDEVGTLEAWNSDGLRSLAKTMDIPNMIEKTLRYPGSIEYLRVLRAGGFFSYDEVEVKGQKIRPVDLTAKLLFPQWQMQPDDEDFTAMQIIVDGVEDGEKKNYTYDLLDRFERDTGTPSMSRTTGYTATAVANLILEQGYSRQGLIPPEFIGEKESDFRFVLDYLRDRKIEYKVKEK